MSRKIFATVLTVLCLAGCGSIAINGTPPPYTDPGTIPAGPTGPVGAVPKGCHFRGSGLYALPDAHCSPGATNSAVTQADINSTICRHGWTKTIRPPESVTGPEKRAMLHAYDATGASRSYELDHLISLELGGAPNSYANYWPEPNYPTREGFYLNPKDRLENKLNDLVCSKKMPLPEAQHLIATDWVSAYRKYMK